MTRVTALLLPLALAQCVDVPTDTTETVPNLGAGPTVEFDPGNSIIPTPNVLIMDPATGLVNIPEQCNESATSAALRTGVLNTLDGFGTFKPAMQVTLTHEVDPLTLPDRIVLMRTSSDGSPVDPAVAQQIPVVAFPGTSYRYTNGCDATPDEIDNITFVPAVPLRGNSTYVAVVKRGLANTGGTPFDASSTWALVRQMTNPVTVDEGGNIVAEKTPLNPTDPEDAASLLGIDLLWKAHATSLAFVDQSLEIPREDVLLAWNIKTQTTTPPLDPTGSGPASMLPTGTPLLNSGGTAGMTAIATADGEVDGFFQTVTQDASICSVLPCSASIDTIFAGAFVTNDFQLQTPNPLSGGDNVPGPWPNPIDPAAQVETKPITVTAFLPKLPPPDSNGYPVVIFGHGITRSRMDVVAIAGQLAGAGIATITFDWVAHGDPENPLGAGQAVQIDDTSTPCTGTPDPTDRDDGGITCFAPFFSSNLASTRDNFRQSVLNALALINALKTCSSDTCGAGFNVNPDKIGYLGQSLGAIIGTMIVSVSPDIKAAVLNVGGVGMVDVIERTQSKALQCPLVDALIEAGVVPGTVSDPVNLTGTCFGDEWKAEPGWQSFANAARWVLDPGDGANFAAALTSKGVLVQEVVNDETVPNYATATLTAIMGIAANAAAVAVSPTPTPSDAIGPGLGIATYIQYSDVTDPTDNIFSHGSLLSPEGDAVPGQLGTAQMQTDAITYLAGSLAL